MFLLVKIFYFFQINFFNLCSIYLVHLAVERIIVADRGFMVYLTNMTLVKQFYKYFKI